MSGKQKGNAYERYICEELSSWWTAGRRCDVFWRTDSGARAKKRGRAGKDTALQHGDIVATDPIGAPFVDLITTEIKRGYSRCTIHDLLDKPAKGGRQMWEEWIDQAQESHEQAGSFSWMIIAKRDRREAIVLIPRPLYDALRPGIYAAVPLMILEAGDLMVYGMPLKSFLTFVLPSDIKTLAKAA